MEIKQKNTVVRQLPKAVEEQNTTKNAKDSFSSSAKLALEDRYVKSNEIDQPITYSKKATLDEIRSMEEKRQTAFQSMLSRMLAKQGEAYNLVLSGKKYNVSVEESKHAQSSIEPGGDYSVDAVATRIMDMAIALSGGDKSKIDTLRDAVEKGFSAAAKAFNQSMPSITRDTYTEVMKRFDAWEKEE